ncbi:MAG: hypothetical protein HC852_11655 [Acaryochloridaceae cyanobacterium RU_4_10]|nr:hypothetical protein [Acaryochloridaceae cyanobacterium RU_4_10]
MTLQEMQNQAMQLSIGDRWRLVQALLGSIQQEASSLNSPQPNVNLIPNLDPWTQSLMGVIQLDTENPTESYVDYLEEKYR